LISVNHPNIICFNLRKFADGLLEEPISLEGNCSVGDLIDLRQRLGEAAQPKVLRHTHSRFLKRGAVMATFIMLTRLNPDAVRSPRDLEREAMKRVREECPDVEWLNSYAVLGPYDYLDVFIANDIETAARVSALIRTFGHAQTEIWTATDWDRFKELVSTLPGPS
jgi:uncharacterized protein with GYD domain